MKRAQRALSSTSLRGTSSDGTRTAVSLSVRSIFVALAFVTGALAIAIPAGAQTPPPPTPASFCGDVGQFFVDDLPAGGYIVIGGTKLTVGGIDARVGLPPRDQLAPGVRVCFDGTVRRHPDHLQGVTGQVTIAPAPSPTRTPEPTARTLPSTSTAP